MHRTVLMCPPTYFDIEYEINAWMSLENQVDRDLALKQWNTIKGVYEGLGWSVQTISPVTHLPDLVFIADTSLVIDNKVALASFRYPQRRPESNVARDWFAGRGYGDLTEVDAYFEGGDCLVWNDYIIAGYPFRSEKKAHKELARIFNKRVLSIELVDPRFYHMDTAITVIDDQTMACFKPALTDKSFRDLKELVPNLIEAKPDDALAYGLNTVSDGQNVIIAEGSDYLIETYQKMGKTIHTVDISEYQKSGGGIKCLTNILL